MTPNSKKKAEVNTKGTNVGTSFAADPEDSEVALVIELDQPGFINCPDSKLTLNSRDQRGTLKKGAGQSLECPSEGFLPPKARVESQHANIFFPGALLRFDQTCGTVDTDQ